MRSVFPWADPRPEISAEFDGSSAVRLLEEIEQLPAGATGALHVTEESPGHEPLGSILVEGGRVCWAVASGMNRRLTDIIRHQTSPPLERATVEDVYRRCRLQGKPFGEYLVSSGLVSTDGLRRALRQHTGEALAMLSRAGGTSVEWRDHPGRRYDARFTFHAGELLVALGALRSYPKAADVNARLQAVLDGSAAGAAFVRSADMALLLPVAAVKVGAQVRVPDFLDLGRWAAGILDLCECFSPNRKVVACVGTDGASTVAWQEGDTAYVAACEDPSTAACVIVRIRRGAG